MKANRKPRFLFDNTKGKDMKKGDTLICCFSRDWCVPHFFKAFYRLRLDPKNFHLLIFNNSINPFLEKSLMKKVKIYSPAFYTTRYYCSYRKGGNKTIHADEGPFSKSKVSFIYKMQQDLLKMITTKRFVLLEDDTMMPPLCVLKLLELLEKNPKCGIATAIATGRSAEWLIPTRLGVHYVLRKGNKIIERVSPPPTFRGVHEVDCCGWYCCASYKDVWARGFDGMREFLPEIPKFALDGFHTNNIHRSGRTILADFSLWCTHLHSAGRRILPWGKKKAVAMADVWLPGFNIYAQGIALKKSWRRPWMKNLKKSATKSR